MIAKLVITINFKSLYLRLVVVNAHLPWSSFSMELFRQRFAILHLSQGFQMFSENQHAEWKRQFVDD